MTISFVNSFQSEWIKKKGSLATLLIVIGSFFTPAIVIVARLVPPPGASVRLCHYSYFQQSNNSYLYSFGIKTSIQLTTAKLMKYNFSLSRNLYFLLILKT